MRIFVLGFPHTQTIDPTDENLVNLCPFTEQVWYFAKMMVDRGHDVIHIGMPGSNPPGGCEHVDAMTEDWWRILYAWKKPEDPFILTRDHAYGQQWTMYAENVRKILLERGGDPYTSIVSCLWGHNECVKDIPQFVVECGIGSPFAHAAFRIYLSHAWRHFHEGHDQNFGGDKWYRQVIPLPINMDMFGPVVEKKDNFFLVQTRMLEPKGVRIAVQVARELQTPIVLTGRGDASSFVAEWPTGAIAAGISSTAVRRDLMRRAKALFSPSRYVEPYGAVAVEAMASGCPVITTDQGGYVDTVVDGYTGSRCNTFAEFVRAAKHVDKINPHVCREWVEKNNSLAVVGERYERYFESLLRLKEGKTWVDRGTDGFADSPPAPRIDYSMFGAK